MTRTPSPHLIHQASKVAELLDQGYSNRRIAEVLRVSSPRVSEIRRVLPELTPYLGNPEPTERLRERREQLWALRRDAVALAAAIRRDLTELDEELQAYQVDKVLGLRVR